MVHYSMQHRQWLLPIGDDLYEVQVVSWYDNENSYTSQMVRTIKYFCRISLIL